MIQTYLDHEPRIDPEAWVHESAVIIGDVTLEPGVSIWPLCVLRGDQGAISIGANSNIQDGSVVHATGGLSTTRIGEGVVVGHRVILHGCIVEDDVLVGMGAILLDNCHIGRQSIIAAGAVVPMGKIIPPRSLVAGVPGRIVRTVTDEDVKRWIHMGAQTYQRLAREHQASNPSGSDDG
jgi:carbonic anhydrase/acetyltransferase-like protein (isoleucine patch superfamily)